MCREKKTVTCVILPFSLFKEKNAFVAWIIRNVLIQNVCMLQHANRLWYPPPTEHV